MQLTDEPEKRCYPLNNRLFCYTCAKRTKTSPHPYSPNTIRASPAYYADRERPSTVSNIFLSRMKFLNLQTAVCVI